MTEQNRMLPILDDRLYLAAGFVRDGAVCADIGTDHAYIPIFLINSGVSPFVIASDVNSSPLDRAKQNAVKYGADGHMEFILSDGLDTLPLEERKVTDIVICGMGGELIANIVSRSEYVKKDGIRLILQPMSAVDDLRRYMASSGFAEVNGDIAETSGKIYQCSVWSYTGECYTLSPAEEFLGKNNSAIRKCELFPALLSKYITKITKERDGKRAGKINTDFEDSLLSEFEVIGKELL